MKRSIQSLCEENLAFTSELSRRIGRMLRAWERATWDRTGSVIGGIDLSVFGTCAGSASGRVSEISSGLEAGFKSEARGRRIPPDKLGAFPATFGGSWKERLGAAGRVGGIRTRRFNRQAFPATLGLDAYSGSSRPAERAGMYA